METVNTGCCQKGQSTADSVAGTQAGIVVYINSARMGEGDEQLGEILMEAFLESLNHYAKEMSHILLVNSGVTLACQGSRALDSLTGLAGMGIKILACGTCLRHLGLAEALAVGEASNMVAIVGAMTTSTKVLSP